MFAYLRRLTSTSVLACLVQVVSGQQVIANGPFGPSALAHLVMDRVQMLCASYSNTLDFSLWDMDLRDLRAMDRLVLGIVLT